MSEEVPVLNGTPSEETGAGGGWQAEARAKKLPERFIERLADSDGVTEREKARIVASVETAAELQAKREAAVEFGRRLGTHEADSRGEIGSNREQRIKRAMAYAAWEFDGKPLSSKEQREEMGVVSPDLPTFSDRAKMWDKRTETRAQKAQ